MEKIIAPCGLICSECPAYLAQLNDDDVLRKKTAVEWSEMYGGEIPPEAINCTGCLEDGIKISHCEECHVRACVMMKRVSHCTECVLYPCNKIEEFHGKVPEAKRSLEELLADNPLLY
ncbi:MAG: DUF3795 domain-containing protein [Candidatus Cloacimonetes bacterium]|nr:DUF3795 domain-containing protein [Candidatus Cloacimonadota bacterium]